MNFIAHNGVIGIRKVDTLDGATLPGGAAVQSVSINDLGQAAHIWTHATGDHLVFACRAADLASSIRVLSNGDGVDLDNDGIVDATVTDINAAASVSPGLDLAEDGRIALNVDLMMGRAWWNPSSPWRHRIARWTGYSVTASSRRLCKA